MDSSLLLLAVLSGYLIGSISFARLIARTLKPEQDLNQVQIPLDSGDGHRLRAVGATTASIVLGAKWGGIIALLDIIKAFVPTLIFRLIFPDQIYYLFAGAGAIAGHIWPLYHRFRGGYGLSPVLGAFLVMDPLGVLVSNALSMFLGLVVLRDAVIVMVAGTWLMVLWVWLVRGDPAMIIFVLVANLLLGFAAIPELSGYFRDRKSGKVNIDEAMQKFPMGRMIQKYFLKTTKPRD
ncbi:glycerol-3-phosphate acyltransferase [Anaerolinea thermophila]|uniref:glycerol-3-phosphate acyltransferase n=2 Tax=Anaerolinea TaxID=233189 RepID=UPI0026EAE791|nr:glycerol-3-phosphate acyltransferase [Anaerolinea thermophila]